MIVASLTDSLVNFCTDLIGSAGYAGVLALMALGSACVPIPSEATMMFAGFKVSDHHLTLIGIVAAGIAGDLIGCCISYAAGYYGRIELLERNKLVHISPKRLALADSWFQRRGPLTVFLGRMVPLLRAFTSLPAGVARMPLSRFVPLTLAGSTIWIVIWAEIGVQVGDRWHRWQDKLHYVDYAVAAALVALIVYALVRRRGGGGEDEPVAEVG